MVLNMIENRERERGRDQARGSSSKRFNTPFYHDCDIEYGGKVKGAIMSGYSGISSMTTHFFVCCFGVSMVDKRRGKTLQPYI
jgi:hypothetical protein